MKQIKSYIKRLYKIIMKNEMRVLPGQIAFFLVLSLIPIVTLFAYVASSFQVNIDFVVDSLNGTLPKEIIDIIIPALQNPGFFTGVSMMIGFFIASNGTHSIIVASNMLFKLDDNGYIRRRTKAILMLIILMLSFAFMLIVFAFGNDIIAIIFKLVFESTVPRPIYELFLFSKWVFGLFLVFFMVKMIFTIGPDSSIPSKNMNKGAFFTTITWILATSFYSIYVSNFSNYNLLYGGLSNIVILMIWIYILSYALVVGIAINSDDYLKEKKELT